MPEAQIPPSQRTDQVINAGKKVVEMLAGAVTKEVTDAMTAISTIAAKGTIIFLQSFGAALIIVCLALKIQIHDHTLADLTRSEYVVTVAGGLLFVIAGSAMRFYILKCALEVQKTLRQTGREILKGQAAAANSQIESITKTALEGIQQGFELPPGT